MKLKKALCAAAGCTAVLLSACGTVEDEYKPFDITTIEGAEKTTAANTSGAGKTTTKPKTTTNQSNNTTTPAKTSQEEPKTLPEKYLSKTLFAGDAQCAALRDNLPDLQNADFLTGSATAENLPTATLWYNGSSSTLRYSASISKASFVYIWLSADLDETEPEEYADDFDAILYAVRGESSAQICVLSPIGENAADYASALSDAMKDEEDVTYLDVSAAITGADGEIADDYLEDNGETLNKKGAEAVYRILAQNPLSE